MSITPIDHEENDERLLKDRLLAEFDSALSPAFAHASRELEFHKIVEQHLQQSPGDLGRKVLPSELQPITDPIKIDTSLKEIAEMRSFFSGNDRPPFSGLFDIHSVLRKIDIEGSTLYVEEGARVLAVLRGMRALREFFSRRASIAPQLWKSGVHLYDDRLLEMHFASVFDDAGNIKDNASTELSKIRREIINTAEHLRSKLSSILRRLTEDSFVQEELITQRDGRYVVPVKVEHKRRVPGFIHSVSQTGQTVFIEPSETLDLNNDLRSLEFAEHREIERIMYDLARQLREVSRELQGSLKAAGHLEAVAAKARYADSIDASPAFARQQTGRERKLVIKEARHPLLLKKLGREKTIPLTLELDELRHTLVLTGPNAGGKTVLLKTVGLLTLMAQAGLPIPALADAELPIMDSIFVEIGDSQSLADDLSTFSSHVRALSRIMDHATSKSLVLLDEIGGGTAPEEGGSLAESILENLTKRNTITIATTHFGRLAAFAETTQGAVNGSMEFSSAGLQPTFRFRMGLPGSSHAFEIAERFGLPIAIIKRAAELRGTGSTKLEDLIRSLETLQLEAREKKAESERELGKARIARVDFERKRDEVDDIRRTAKQTAATEAESILKQANSFVERAVKDAREAARKEISSQNESTALRELRAQQEAERKNILKSLERKPEPVLSKELDPTELKVGAKAQLRSNPGQVGEIVSIKGKDVVVLLGGLRVKTKLDQIEAVKEASRKEKRRQDVSQATQYLSEAPVQRIDLRGEYGDDAVMQVEKFLGDAAAHNLARVEIIHGMGTGALGRRISQYLKTHPSVQSFKYGEPHEGGAGVTIVELR